MQSRLHEKTITFRSPFRLAGIEGDLPAGDYVIETDEELLQSMSFLAYRRVATFIRLPSASRGAGPARTLKIDGNDLDAAVRRDEALTHLSNVGASKPPVSAQTRFDREAVARAEEDGMIIPPWPDISPIAAVAGACSAVELNRKGPGHATR